MTRRIAQRIVACAVALVMAACASPPARFYALRATAPPGAAAPELSVVVDPVAVPAAVDRPQIVVSAGSQRLELEDYARWAAPLQDGIGEALVANLIALLGTPRVALLGQASSAIPDYRVRVVVLTFAAAPGESVDFDAVYTVRRTRDDESRSGRTRFHGRLNADGYDAVVGRFGDAVAELGGDIVRTILTLRAPARGAGTPPR